MSTDTFKIRSKLTKLDKSLDELESQLEPLFAKSLPETLLALDTIQQAKLHVIIPYVVYDLVFVYLKSRGIDPKTHRVVAELDRIRQYFDKIKHAEETDQKRKLGIDKAAASRFIKHAIAQAKNAQLVDEPSDDVPAASSSSTNECVPIKVTSKMMARAEYEKELKELGGGAGEDIEVFDEDAADDDQESMDTDGPPEETRLDKGKGRAEEISSSRRKRPRIDPFSGYEGLAGSESTPEPNRRVSVRSTPTNDPLRGASVPETGDREAGKAAKRAKRKAQEPRNSPFS